MKIENHRQLDVYFNHVRKTGTLRKYSNHPLTHYRIEIILFRCTMTIRPDLNILNLYPHSSR